MKRLAICELSLVACAVIGTTTWAADKQLLVEVACVVRTQEKAGAQTLEEEVSAAIKASKVASSGLESFLKEWLADKDRSQFTLTTMRVKAPMGAEIEVETGRSEGDDPEGEVANPGVIVPKKVGLSLTMTGTETDEGKIDLTCRFSKATPAAEFSATGPDGKPVYGFRTFMVSPRITLEPNVPSVIGGLVSEKREKDKTLIVESLMIFRAVPEAR